MSCLGLLPPFTQECYFRFSTDQRCQSSGLSNIKATGGTALAEHVVYVHGLSDATEGLCSQVLTLEIALDYAVGGSTHCDGIGRRQSLDARTHVWNFTERQLFLSPLTPHLPHND